MQHEATGLEHQVVAEVELVDVDRQPRHGRSDRSAHGAVRDHAVALAVALARDGHDWRGQLTQQLVNLLGLELWHGPLFSGRCGRAARRRTAAPPIIYTTV